MAPGLSFSQQEPIERVNPGIASTYLGSPDYPQPNLLRLQDGHLQIIGPTGGWASQTNLLTIVANPSAAGGYGNNGSQGNFWDPAYRLAYGGQDAAAMFINIAPRTPMLVGAPVKTFGTTTIATPIGNRVVYTITLDTPLDQRQLAALAARPPTLRVETDNGFFAYLVPRGLLAPDGAAVSPVSADGATLVVDNWVRVEPKPQIASSAGALPSKFAPAATSITLDPIHTIDESYGSVFVSDADLVTGATGDERVFVNDKSSRPILDLTDPLSSKLANGTPFLMMGSMAGVQPQSRSGSGVGTAYVLANGGWQAAFVARNAETAASGPTYGLLVPSVGASWAVYSTQRDGFLLGADPGNTGHRTVLLDTRGNLALSGHIVAGEAVVAPQIQANGTLTVRGRSGAPAATIDGDTGRMATQGVIVSGTDTRLHAPQCVAGDLGAHFYITDGRKPGEAPGNGSGVPVDCTPVRKGAAPVWVSVYDHAPVTN